MRLPNHGQNSVDSQAGALRWAGPFIRPGRWGRPVRPSPRQTAWPGRLCWALPRPSGKAQAVRRARPLGGPGVELMSMPKAKAKHAARKWFATRRSRAELGRRWAFPRPRPRVKLPGVAKPRPGDERLTKQAAGRAGALVVSRRSGRMPMRHTLELLPEELPAVIDQHLGQCV
jgi:hypothetical protein